MPYARPTLTQLIDQTQSDILNGGIEGVDTFLAQGILLVLSIAQSGLAWQHYGYIDYIALQAVPWTATDEFLEAWGALKGVVRKPATAAVLQALYAAPAGTDVAASTAISRQDGTLYTTNADVLAGNSGAMVTITAQVPGSAGNCAIGTTLSLSAPIEGVTTAGAVTAIVTAGADVESDDDLRTRVLQAFANPPGAGKASDYIEWAEAVPGVTRAWCVPHGQGPGTVVVYTMFDNSRAAQGGFPQGTNGVAAGETRDVAATGDQLEVANAIFLLQPVTALVYSCAPAAYPINFSITGLGTGNTATNQAAISAALTGLMTQAGSANGSTIQPDQWEEAIAAIATLPQFTVSAPATAVSIPVGYLPTLGNVTFAS